MRHLWITQLAMVFMTSSSVMAQVPTDLPGFLSVAQSLAGALDPSSTTSSSTSSTSRPLTSSRSTSRSSSTTSRTTSTPSSTPAIPAATIASSTVPSASASSASTGLDPHTRTVLLAVTIPVGLVALATIIALFAILCCRRSRRGTRRSDHSTKIEEAKFIGHNDWEYGDNHHHGFDGNTGEFINARNDTKQDSHFDVAPLMGTNNALESKTTHPAPEHNLAGTGIQKPLAATRPLSRKPVPNRDSNGSAITTNSTNHRHDNHSGAAIGAGVGALAGAAAMHHHDKNRNSNGSPARPDFVHKPLSSHPQDPSHIYASSGPSDEHVGWRPTRPSTPPFSPDDVGSTHRKSQRFSQGAALPTTTASDFVPSVAAATVNPPTSEQRRSLQSRHSSYNDEQESSRRTSRSPKRRSLSGGGEIWQADPMFMPALSSRRRSGSGGGLQYTATEAAPPLPTQAQYRGRDFSQSALLSSPSPPYNRHLAGAQGAHSRNLGYTSNTDSSTSNDSWESANEELNSWEHDDPGRYPRFSGGTTDSRVPLIPPNPVWSEGQRRWSGDAPKLANGRNYKQSDNRRYSGGNDRRQRLRFSEGNPEYYDDAGLVGRAL